MTAARPKRPSDEQHARALALYRANATPEAIAERVGLTLEQVECAMIDGWPARGGKHPKDALPSFESAIEDRVYRLRNAELDWAQAVAEAAAVKAKGWLQSVKIAVSLEHAVLKAWAIEVKKEIEGGKKPAPLKLAIPIDVVRSLKILREIQNPTQEKAVAEIYRFLRGGTDEEMGSETEAIQAALAEMTDEQQDHYADTGERPPPDQTVLKFPAGGKS